MNGGAVFIAMLNEYQKKIINEHIQNTISTNKEVIASALCRGINDDTPISQLYPKMIDNAIRISASIAMQEILNLLDEIGVIDFEADETLLRRSQLKVVSSDHENHS